MTIGTSEASDVILPEPSNGITSLPSAILKLGSGTKLFQFLADVKAALGFAASKQEVADMYIKKIDAASTYLAKTDAEKMYKPKNYTFSTPSSGTEGYNRFANIVIKNSYVNLPIEFHIARRGEERTRLTLIFMNASDTDPNINYFTADGPCKDAYMVKTSASHWTLYVMKKTKWDDISIDDYTISKHIEKGVEVKFIAEFSATLPSGAIKAT